MKLPPLSPQHHPKGRVLPVTSPGTQLGVSPSSPRVTADGDSITAAVMPRPKGFHLGKS